MKKIFIVFLVLSVALSNITLAATVTDLFRAMDAFEFDTFKSLLSSDKTLANAVDFGGEPALMRAARTSNYAAAEILLVFFEANPNSHRDNLGRTPLHHAVQKQNLELSRLLVEHQADREATDTFGEIPFTWAQRFDNQPLMDLLVPDTLLLKNVNASWRKMAFGSSDSWPPIEKRPQML